MLYFAQEFLKRTGKVLKMTEVAKSDRDRNESIRV